MLDETGTINITEDSKGVLILSPGLALESLTLNEPTLIHYMNWLHQAWSQARYHASLLFEVDSWLERRSQKGL